MGESDCVPYSDGSMELIDNFYLPASMGRAMQQKVYDKFWAYFESILCYSDGQCAYELFDVYNIVGGVCIELGCSAGVDLAFISLTVLAGTALNTVGGPQGGRFGGVGLGARRNRPRGYRSSLRCGPMSFSGDTQVLMADGTTKPIQDITVGDQVLATEPETGEHSARTVTHVWVHQDQLVDLQLDNSRSVTTTEDHLPSPHTSPPS